MRIKKSSSRSKKKRVSNRFNPLYILIAILASLISFLVGSLYKENYIQSNTPTTPAEIAVSEVEEKFPGTQGVKRVVDGDTVFLEDGRKVRYIGVNSVELKEKTTDRTALEFNRKLVEGKKVRLVYPVREKSRIDPYGRLLAYLWVKPDFPTLTKANEDGQINVNVELVRQGMAKVVIYPRRAKLIYQDELLAAEALAKKEKLGVWAK